MFESVQLDYRLYLQFSLSLWIFTLPRIWRIIIIIISVCVNIKRVLENISHLYTIILQKKKIYYLKSQFFCCKNKNIYSKLYWGAFYRWIPFSSYIILYYIRHPRSKSKNISQNDERIWPHFWRRLLCVTIYLPSRRNSHQRVPLKRVPLRLAHALIGNSLWIFFNNIWLFF